MLADAEMRLVGPDGVRVIGAADFFTGFLSTAIHEDEILVEVVFPWSVSTNRWGFAEFAQRRGDFALGGAACIIPEEPATGVRVVAFGAADRTIRCLRAEALLQDSELTVDTIKAAAMEAGEEVRTHLASDDPETAYRFHLVEPMVLRALEQATARG